MNHSRQRRRLLVAMGAAALLPLGPAMAWLNPLEDGQPAPALRLPDLSGNSIDLESYRGKVILVNFWATWCPPCIRELPSMRRLKETLGSEGLEILAVNRQESPRRVAQFLKQTPVNFPVLLDESAESSKAWNAEVLPTSFLVGPGGHIRYTAVGPLDWDSEEVLSVIRPMLPGKK
ncbi:MAG: TlpA disulfide reductase family protein [Pseudomonadota bacterium]